MRDKFEDIFINGDTSSNASTFLREYTYMLGKKGTIIDEPFPGISDKIGNAGLDRLGDWLLASSESKSVL